MRVIGVLDLLAGRAVHARAGRREHYVPVRAVVGSPIEAGDALALAHIYVERFGLTELYAADLDAILGGASQNQPILAAVAAVGVPLWVDAGVSSVVEARRTLDLGAARVIVGLETLTSFDVLGEICAAVGGDLVAFSLDLRAGTPVVAPGAISFGITPRLAAERAVDAGAGAVIVLDLQRVGTGTGPDLGLVSQVRTAVPDVLLLVGGGVRGLEDLAQLADSGCDAAIVASALHDGRLGVAEVVAARQLLVRSCDAGRQGSSAR
jgi:phosphoribosylformimino-5-aminoimidazole carboxamide ribotide isomerase